MRWRIAFALVAMAAFLALPLSPPAGGERRDARVIFIDVDAKCLYLFEGKDELRRYTVATGAWDTPTPLGVFRINSRFRSEMSGFGTCFLGLNVPWGQYGIHGTNKPESIGANASHGCVRLRVEDAEELYDLAPNGTRVVIQSGSYGELGDTLRPLRSGDRSSMVCAVQRKLRALGYYYGWPDGVYGAATEKAVAAARRALGLAPGEVDWAFYKAIGLTLFE